MSELRAACWGSDGWPTVSVVLPIRNEASHLERAVTSILRQDYPLPFDIWLAVAPSDDDTEAIAAAVSDREPRVSVVTNPAGVTPAGLNVAIAAANGDIIVRVDGHAELSDGYIRRAVETMRKTGAVNVGGRQLPVGESSFEAAVAAAMTSRFGTGGAKFHVGGPAGPVDTVYLGVFDRAAGDLTGWFDESLIRNQDYEFNIRLRQAGGTVWFDPELSITYRPRGTLARLARQYYEYGYWKAAVLRDHPDSLKLRQAIPAASTPLLIAAALLGTRRRRWLIVPGVYALATAAVSWRSRTERASPPRITIALLTIQQAWGIGFLAGTANLIRRWVADRAA